MATETVQVRIQTSKGETTHTIRRGLGFQALCSREKTAIEYDCRNSDCGICIFRVIEGQTNLSQKTVREADFLKAMGADPDERLACQTRILGNVVVCNEFA